MEAFPDDDIVGVVLAHELAHNVMGHIEKMAMQRIGDEFVSHLVYKFTGARATGDIYATLSYLESSVDYEFEADYVGLYFTARAGLGYEKAPAFLRKIALDAPGTINRSSTHPKLSERFVAQEAAIAEIRRKISQGQALIPEMKMDWEKERKPSMKDGVAPVAVGLGLGG
jgi:Zn-dependent protease with chaperone function